MLMFIINMGYAQKQSAEEFALEAWQILLDENRITQLEFNQKEAQLKYQIQQQQRTQLAPIKSLKVDGPGGTASISGIVSAVDPENIYISVCETYIYNCIYGAFTDQFGVYTVVGLPAGSYFVRSFDNFDDYVNSIWSATGTEPCHNNCQTDADNQVILADAEVRLGVNLDLVVGASVSGTVVSGATPVENAYVEIRNTPNTTYYGGTNTDASGNYSLKGLPADDYYIQIRNTQDIYIDAMWSDIGTVQCYDCIPDVDSTLSLGLGDLKSGVDLNLTIGATVSGQVTDQDTAAAVETLSVQLYDTAQPESYWYFDSVFDGSGNYTISGVPAGNYKVYLNPYDENIHIPEIYNDIQCNACSTLLYNGAGNAFNLVNGVTTSNIDFAVEVGASVSGFVRDNNDIDLTVTQYALIYLFNDSNRVLAYKFIDGTDYDPMANGAYTVGGLLPGMYFIQGGDGGRQFYQRELFENIACPWSGCDRGGGGNPVVLGEGEQRLGVNFLLNYGGKISGTVTDANTGLPIDNGSIGEYVQFYDASGAVAGGAYIQPDGTYISARALPPGSYSVRTGSMFNAVFNTPYVMEKYAPGDNIDCPGVTCDLTAGNVTVTAYDPLDPTPAESATVIGIDFALSEAFSFSGTITDLSPPNDPIADVHVIVYNDNGDFANWATTDASGNFTVHGLPAGTYYALTNNGSNLPFMGLSQTEAGGWIDILFDGTPCPGSACDVTTGDPIVLGGGRSAQGVTFDFGMTAGGTITGQVRNFSNQLPASGVDVNVYNSTGDFYGSYETDDNGFYLTVGFPAGTYYLTTSNNGALIDAKYGGGYCVDESCDPLDADPIVVVGNQAVVGADIELRPDYIFKTGLE
jgi:hypothetical protein